MTDTIDEVVYPKNTKTRFLVLNDDGRQLVVEAFADPADALPRHMAGLQRRAHDRPLRQLTQPQESRHDHAIRPRAASHQLALALAITAFATAAPAFGRAPEREHVQQTFEGVIDCGTFQDPFTDEETGDLAWYLDANGQLVRFVVHVSQYSTDVNSLTGVTLHEHNHHTSTYDAATGQITLDGAIVHATLPGQAS